MALLLSPRYAGADALADHKRRLAYLESEMNRRIDAAPPSVWQNDPETRQVIKAWQDELAKDPPPDPATRHREMQERAQATVKALDERAVDHARSGGKYYPPGGKLP